MTKYLIKFTKHGYIRYTSHLDLMRLFQRCLKRADIPVSYSNGFHPHPKLSIAQPLSLGYASRGEYLEIEVEKTQSIKEQLNQTLPEGIEILTVKPMTAGTKSLAALIEYGGYKVSFMPEMPVSDAELNVRTAEFLSQAEITAEKFQKKSGKYTTIDIKPLIYILDTDNNIKDNITSGLRSSVDDKLITLTFTIKTGSNSNLNPELLLKKYLEFTEITAIPGSIDIMRQDLYFLYKGELRSLEEV